MLTAKSSAKTAIAVALALVVLAACVMKPTIDIYNNTNVELDVHVDRDVGTAGWDDKIVPIKSGVNRRFLWGQVVRESHITVSAAGCAYVYAMPAEHWPDIQFDNRLGVQIQPDFRVYLAPPGKPPTPLERLAPAQRDGFPLHPLSRTCRPQRQGAKANGSV